MKTSGKLPYVCLYLDNLEAFRELPLHSVGRLVMAMLTYMETAEEPQLKGVERVLWPGLRAKMLRDQRAYAERCEKNRLKGAKGGKQKQLNRLAAQEENAEDSCGYQQQADLANKNENENESENENENENNNKNNNKKENKNNINNNNENQTKAEREEGSVTFAAAPPDPQFVKPTLEEVLAYCRTKCYVVNAEAFWKHQEANGWMEGSVPITDWKAALVNWVRNEYSRKLGG